MEAIVLAGGLGAWLRSVVVDLPKPMAPIGERPFLETLLNMIAARGFSKAILSVGFMAETIISHFGACYAGLKIAYVIEDRPLGTGGGVRLAMDHVTADHVFVFNGDTFLDLESHHVEQLWQTRRRPIIVGCEVLDTSRYGRLLTQKGIAKGLTEKGVSGSGLINPGCYVLESGQLNKFKSGDAFFLEADFLISAVGSGSFEVLVSSGVFIDIGIPEDY